MKKILFITISVFFFQPGLYAQKPGPYIHNGNKLYKQNNFAGSADEYKKALAQAPGHPLANYNLGNAQFRNNELDEAEGSYDNTVKNTSSKKPIVEKAYYNKGVAYSKQQKLQESIDAWKNALKIDPADQEARENLQKALMEQKKQQQQKQQDKKEDEKKNDKQDKKEQEKQKKDQPQPQQSKLNKKQVEQLLKALAQKENDVQQKMQQKNASSSGRQEKDW